MTTEQLFLERKGNPIYNTSYPIHPSDWAKYRVTEPLSFDSEEEISFYIHVPFCKQLCSFCEYTRMMCPDETTQKQYLITIAKDVSSFIASHGSDIKLRGFDIGGGTPTALSEGNLRFLLHTFSETLNLIPPTPDFEPSIEATFNTLTEAKLTAIVSAGIQRLSLGIQSTSKEVLSWHHRPHSDIEHMAHWINAAHAIGIRKINLDLMYGLKGQTNETIAADLRAIETLNPEQVTLYELRTNMIASKEIPDKDVLFMQYSKFYEGLTSMGYYARFGQNTFSKSQADLGVSSYLRSRMMQGVAYKGFGISAQSMSRDGVAYNVGKSSRDIQSLLSLLTYSEEYVHKLPPIEVAAKYIAIGAYNGSVSLQRVKELLRSTSLPFTEEMDYLLSTQLMEIVGDRLCITEKGFHDYGAAFSLLYEKMRN